MSKATEKADAEQAAAPEIEAVLKRLADGDDLPSGWGFDASQDPPVFKVEETPPAQESDATN